MAKKMKKFLALVLALTLCLVQIAIPVSAAGPNNWWHPGWFPGGGNGSNEPNQIEYYEVYLQGNLIASASSSSYYFLGTHYTAGASVNGNTLTWYINPVGGDSGNFGGSVNLTDYIVIPEGFTVSKFNVAESTVDGVNDPNTYMYDNCIIHITIETIYNEETGEEIPVPDPTMTDVTVIHNYYTKDLYTNESVLDGTSTTGGQAYAGESFTASPVTSYNGTEYAQTTDASALTISVSEDAAQNVIVIDYLRTIDTTPTATSVTVIHNYYTEDVYTGITALDGTSSVVAAATEFDTYTASPIASYNGNAYAMTTDASALTITVSEDAAQNVITVNYLRTIDTTPKATSVTVIHNYYTEDVYTEETKLDGTSSVVAAATEFDTYTASPVTAYGGNDYEMTSDASALTISVVADAEQNVITINYLRTIDTAPKNTTVTVIHNYYTEDVYTEETVKDGDATIISEAIEHDSFTATPITQFDGNEYEMTTGEDALTITIHADDEKNLVVINYLRTVDSTPIDYEPSVSITKTAD